MKVTIKINRTQVQRRFEPMYHRAQQYLDNEVLKDCTPYVPMNTGNLMQSGIRGTVIGSGEVVWNAPYAARCYYGNMNFQKKKHPLACRQWFEAAKSVNKDKWIKGAAEALKG